MNMKEANDALYGHDYATNGYQMFGQTLKPEMVQALERYVQDRIPTGRFLRAALCNDFKETVGRAEYEDLQSLAALAAYMYNEMPTASQGSAQKVAAWLAHEE